VQARSLSGIFTSEKTPPLRVRTPRLELIAATLPLITAEVAGAAELARNLDAELQSWPPPLNDASSLQWTYEHLKAEPELAGFFVWYVILVEENRRTLVGLLGFKGPPGQQGILEVGYSVLEAFQRRGIGAEATRALMHWAFENFAVREIHAETFPDLTASIKLMLRCGMKFRGEGSEGGTVRYGLAREDFLRDVEV
jgi:ribosomal-protein-alanine N-acetyltransferase